MSLSANFPTVRPSLALDFAATRSLDPRITFTRASTATYYDDHTVSKAEENLLLRSQEFDNAAWVKQNSIFTADATTAPDGTTTADTLSEGTTAAVGHYFNTSFSISANTTYAASIFAKNVDGQYVFITLRGASGNIVYAVFDISAGTLSTSGALGTGFSVTSTSITSVGNGWYRCVLVAQVGANISSNGIQIGMSDGSAITSSGFPVYTGTSRTIHLWGAQVEQRSSVTAYTATTTQAVTNYVPQLLTAAANVARFEHNPVTRESLGLEIEEGRTNLVLRSEEFDNAAWTKTASSITANTVVAPDGSLTGDKWVESSSNEAHWFAQDVSITSGVAYTITIFAKQAERSVLQITSSTSMQGNGNAFQNFDLATGTLGSSLGGKTASITPVGNGWLRCQFTDTASATASGRFIIAVVNSTAATRLQAYQGNGFSGIFIWGAQLEAGAFATSYIPTVASQVTRSADAASMTGTNFSSWYRADEGTMYAETVSPSPATGQTYLSADINAQTRMSMYTNAGAGSWFVRDSNVTQALISSGSVTAGVSFKMAGAYKVNDFSAAAQGSLGTPDTSGVVPAVGAGSFFIGSYSLGAQLNGTVKKLAYYPARLTNAQLQALTTV